MVDIKARPEESTLKREGDDEYVLSFLSLLQILRRRVWLILAITILIAGAAVGLTLLQTPMYQASTKILVGQAPGVVNTPQASVWTPDLLNQLTATLVEGVKSRPLAEDALDELGWQMTPDQLLGNLNAEQVAKTQFVRVSYTDSSPERA